MPQTKLLRSLFDRYPSASLVINGKGEIKYCTSRAKDIIGDQLDSGSGGHISHIFNEEINWEEFINERSSNARLNLKSGREIITLHIEPLTDVGEELYLVHFDIDNPFNKLSVLDRNTKEVVLLTNTKGVIIDCSVSASNVLGYSPIELIGHELESYLLNKTFSKLHDQILSMADGISKEQSIIFRLKASDNSILWMEADVDIVKSKDIEQVLITCRDISERMLAESQRDQLSKRFLEVYESIDEGIVYQDKNGAITSANKAAERILGISLEQMQGRTSMHPDWKVIHEDGSDYPGETHPAMITLKTGKESKNNIMGVFHPSSGSYRWIKVNSYPLVNTHDDLPAVYATFSDITAEYEKTQALKKSDSLFRTLFNNAFQFIGLLSTEGRLLDANQTGLKFLGLEKEDAIGAFLWDTQDGVLDEDAKEKMQLAISKAANGEFVRYDLELTGVNGDTITLDFSLRPVIDEEGKVSVIIPEGRDVTEKKLLTKELARYSAIMVEIVESIPSAIIYTDPEMNILRLNRSFYELFGYTTVDKEQLKLSELFEDKISINGSHSNNSNDEQQLLAIKKNGEKFPVRLTIANVVEHENDIFGKLFLIEDISTQLESERLKNEFTDQLSNRVEERTKELKQAKIDLEKALSVQKELNKLQSHFVLSASHQFRTPLTIIQSNAELLQQLSSMNPANDSRFVTYSNKITSQVKRTIELMDDILMLGKITSGALKPSMESIDLQSTLNQLIEQFDNTESQGRVKMIIEGDQRRVKIDKKLSEEAINNLLSNALKYSENEVFVKLNYGNTGVKIDIKDSGIGIDPEDLQNIGQPFFRSDEVQQINGTGLGLSIAKEYIEVQGGRLAWNSEQNKGTVFSIEFDY